MSPSNICIRMDGNRPIDNAADLVTKSKRQLQGGLTVWFTGLPGAGKSTIAQNVLRRLERLNIRSEWLDGDVLRGDLCRDLDFNKRDREEKIRRIAWVASRLVHHGIIVLVSVESPYRESRDAAQSTIGRFADVFVNAPLEVCEHRDPKGMFRRAHSGEITNFPGVSDVYEPPLEPTLECRTDRETEDESAEKVMSFLQDRGFIRTFRALTRREIEVLALLSRGLTSKEIAEDLGTSIETIANHRKHLCYKLHVHSTAELVRMAVITQTNDVQRV